MDFNFYEQYKNYTNFELLQILKQPGNYQPAAVEAATLILQQRQVSEQEAVAVNDHLTQIAQQEQSRKEKSRLLENRLKEFARSYITRLQRNLVSFVEPYMKPDARVRPAKWLDILLIVMAIQYAWLLVGLFQRMVVVRYFPGSEFFHYRFSIIMIFDFIYLLIMPVVFFLLLERKRWGWILLFAYYLSALLIQFPKIVSIFDDMDAIGAYNLYFISLLLKVLLVIFLWRKEITDLLNVPDKTKQYTAVLTVIGVPILIGIIYVIIDR